MKTIFFTLFFISLILLNTLVYAESAGISKQEAVAIATQVYPGRVLAVKFKNNTYLVKTLNTNGKVHIVKVDSVSGNIISGSRADSRPQR